MANSLISKSIVVILMEFFFVSCNLAKKSEKKKKKLKMKIHIGAGQVPYGAGMRGRKFSRERGRTGMGDGAGPQTHPIAIPI